MTQIWDLEGELRKLLEANTWLMFISFCHPSRFINVVLEKLKPTKATMSVGWKGRVGTVFNQYIKFARKYKVIDFLNI